MTVSSQIDELEDAHRDPMSEAEKQAWAEVQRLEDLDQQREAERDAALASAVAERNRADALALRVAELERGIEVAVERALRAERLVHKPLDSTDPWPRPAP